MYIKSSQINGYSNLSGLSGLGETVVTFDEFFNETWSFLTTKANDYIPIVGNIIVKFLKPAKSIFKNYLSKKIGASTNIDPKNINTENLADYVSNEVCGAILRGELTGLDILGELASLFPGENVETEADIANFVEAILRGLLSDLFLSVFNDVLVKIGMDTTDTTETDDVFATNDERTFQRAQEVAGTFQQDISATQSAGQHVTASFGDGSNTTLIVGGLGIAALVYFLL